MAEPLPDALNQRLQELADHIDGLSRSHQYLNQRITNLVAQLADLEQNLRNRADVRVRGPLSRWGLIARLRRAERHIRRLEESVY